MGSTPKSGAASEGGPEQDKATLTARPFQNFPWVMTELVAEPLQKVAARAGRSVSLWCRFFCDLYRRRRHYPSMTGRVRLACSCEYPQPFRASCPLTD
jgi:hypothetical protein